MERHRRAPGSSQHRQGTRVLVMLLATSATGCGAAYTARVLEATQLVEEAHSAGAETYAPYPYYTAVLYLEKAREEAGEAEYQHALDACDTAHRSAEEALTESRRQNRTNER